MNQTAINLDAKYVEVTGGNKLEGCVSPDGAKNSALIQLAALALVDDNFVSVSNVPEITDVDDTIEMLREIGLHVKYESGEVTVSGSLSGHEFSYGYASRIRSSLAFLGAVIAKRGKIVLPLPGGDKIGPRPIDIHINVLETFGVDVVVKDKYIYANASVFPLKGADVSLRYPSVLATVNAILLAVHAEGKSVLHNVAKEPEIVDLTNLLCKMGADIRGVGTDKIVVQGVKALNSTYHEVMPDRLEAAALIMAIVMSGGKGIVEKTIPEHNEPLIDILRHVGVTVDVMDDKIEIKEVACHRAFDAETRPFPGLATDVQPIMTPLGLMCPGQSRITDTVHKERFSHSDELLRMGAAIEKVSNSIYLNGQKTLKPAVMTGSDIRSVVSLINAALYVEGTSEIYGVHHLLRGHGRFIEKLNSLGADICFK